MPGSKKMIFKEMMHFHDMAYMAMPQHTTPARGIIKFIILVDSSLVIITTYYNALKCRGR